MFIAFCVPRIVGVFCIVHWSGTADKSER